MAAASQRCSASDAGRDRRRGGLVVAAATGLWVWLGTVRTRVEESRQLAHDRRPDRPREQAPPARRPRVRDRRGHRPLAVGAGDVRPRWLQGLQRHPRPSRRRCAPRAARRAARGDIRRAPAPPTASAATSSACCSTARRRSSSARWRRRSGALRRRTPTSARPTASRSCRARRATRRRRFASSTSACTPRRTTGARRPSARPATCCSRCSTSTRPTCARTPTGCPTSRGRWPRGSGSATTRSRTIIARRRPARHRQGRRAARHPREARPARQGRVGGHATAYARRRGDPGRRPGADAARRGSCAGHTSGWTAPGTRTACPARRSRWARASSPSATRSTR